MADSIAFGGRGFRRQNRRYQPPTITGITPVRGAAPLTTSVTITGTNFLVGASVIFDSIRATAVVVNSSTSITCTTPIHIAGTVNVTVMNPDSQSATLASAYQFDDAPVVGSVTPSVGFATGTTAVNINGTGFISGATLLVDGSPVTVSFSNSTLLTATLPAHVAGAVNVTVTNPDTQASTLVGGFTYQAAPSVTSLSPIHGPATLTLAGVVINGTDFVATPTVVFGGTSATSVVFNSSTQLTCTTPVHASGSVTVSVTNPDTQVGSLPAGYLFDGAPTNISVTPSSGFATATTAVTIIGTNFVNGATVTFAGTPATSVVWNSSTSISCVTPTHAQGAVAVVVTNPDTQTGTNASAYTYNNAPTVTNVNPSTGFSSTTTAGVIITGTDFVATPTVDFGGTAATSIVRNSSTQLTCTAPAHTAGAVTVSVTNPDTQVGSLAAAFTYSNAPTVTAVSPQYGSTLGNTAITLTGTDFVSTPTVKIGGTSCTSVVRVSSTQVTCTTAAKAFGTYDIVVTNPDTQTGTLSPGFSHYSELDFTSLTPGPFANAAFLSTTGLTGFTRADTTVSANQTTVQTSSVAIYSNIGADKPRIFSDGTNRGFLIEHAVTNQVPGSPHNINGAGWTASGQGTQTSAATTGPDGTATQASRLSMSAISNICNYYDLTAESSTLYMWSSWQKSASAALTDMQTIIQNNAGGPPGSGSAAVRAGSSNWGRIPNQKTNTLRRYFWACDTYNRSINGQGGQTARGRDVYVDFMQIEYGDFMTSAIGAAGAVRAQDRATWTMPFSSSRMRFYASFKPILRSVSGSYRTDGGPHTAWPVYTYDAKNDVTIDWTTKKLTVKSNNVTLTSSTALSWEPFDNIELLLNIGNNVTSSVAWRSNSGSWTSLTLSTVTGSAVPSIAIQSASLFTGTTADQNALPCVIQKLRVYPRDVVTTDV